VVAHDWPEAAVSDHSMTPLVEKVLPRLADLALSAAAGS
jgi:hypothetical protein